MESSCGKSTATRCPAPPPIMITSGFGVGPGSGRAGVVPRLRTVTDGLDSHAREPGLPRLLAALCKQVIMATRWAVILLTLVLTTALDVLGFPVECRLAPMVE
jgi:hypothetical protein